MTALALTAQRLPAAIRQQWRALALIGAMVGIWLVAAVSITLSGLQPALPQGAVPSGEQRLRAAAAATSATQLKQVSAGNALAMNAAIPIADAANPAALPFGLARSAAADRLRSLDCLTAAVYYEAANEPVNGQRAVAQVVLNRVRHPAYPNSVCGVVFEGARRSTGCQFSFSCDGSLRRAPMASHWGRARQVAEAALNGYVYAPVGWATHYHANYVVPYWSSSLVKSANVGMHIFYRWRGGWGRPNAFGSRYAGVEPAIAWRGGFGQPVPSQVMTASARDLLAAQAAVEAATMGSASVDSFQRAVLRRYEPLQRDTANAQIAERARADASLSTSQRWALTGDASATPQRQLGRNNAAVAPQPVELQGVRFRADPAPAPAPAPASGGNAAETAAR